MSGKKRGWQMELMVLAGVLLLFILPLTNAYSLTYDSAKNSVKMGYDSKNRILNQTGSNDWVKYVYDASLNDTLTNSSNDKGVVISYNYDERKRVVRETKKIDGYTFEKTNTYDSMDRTTSNSGSFKTINFTYGSNSLMSSILNIVTLSYNEKNQYLNKSFNNNLKTFFVYNNRFGLTNIQTDTKQSLKYGYDKKGNIIAINDTSNSRNLSMKYDKIYRLINVNIDAQQDAFFNYTYNSIGNLLNITSLSGSQSYGYSSLAHAPTLISGGSLDNPPMVNLVTPTNNSVDTDGVIVFNCSATDDNNLKNITLYGNWSNGWHANETKSLTGTLNSTTFTKTLPNGIYKWNCLAYDNSSQKSLAASNWTINVSATGPINNPPQVTLISPANNSVDSDGTVTFSCSATDDYNLRNITLYGSWGSGWHANETKSVSGVSNSTTFTKTLQNGVYKWNCLAYDNSSNKSFASNNWTINVSVAGPSPKIELSLISPPNFSDLSVNQNQFFPISVNVSCSVANCGEINVSFDPIPIEERTSSTDKVCENGVCALTIYSGIRNVYEDGKWKRVEDARSLKDKGFYVKYLEKDPDFDVSVIDFNYNSITVELMVSEKYLSREIPLTIWEEKMEFASENALKEKTNIKEMKIEARSKSIETYEFGLNKTLKFGFNSTVLVLQENETENLDDAAIASMYPNQNYAGNYLFHECSDVGHAHSLERWNISNIDFGDEILSANLTLYPVYYDLSTNDSQINISTHALYHFPAYNISNSPWTEETVTWNLRPSTNQYNQTPSDTIITRLPDYTSPISWDVTNIISAAAKSGYSDASIYLKTPEPYCVNGGLVSFVPKEDDLYPVQYRPKLTITYHAMKAGLISSLTGDTPFYTNQSNPRTINLNSGQSQIVTAWVNATGESEIKHTFFIFTNKTSQPSISNVTAKWNVTIKSSSLPSDSYKLYVKNSTGSNVAWLGSEGNIVLKGSCISGGVCNAPANSFVIGNASDNTTAYIDMQGNLCVEKGDCSFESASCNPSKNALIIRDSANVNMSYIDFDGDLCLRGKLYQNSNL